MFSLFTLYNDVSTSQYVTENLAVTNSPSTRYAQETLKPSHPEQRQILLCELTSYFRRQLDSCVKRFFLPVATA